MKNLGVVLMCCLASLSGKAQAVYPRSGAFAADEYRAFDFWVGQWDVLLRIRQPDLQWKDARHAIEKVYPVLDGKAILELWNEAGKEDSAGIRGFSLRYYNPASGKWDMALNWPHKNFSRTVIYEGEERHNRFEFRIEYVINDSTSQKELFTFADITPNSLRWDDNYSVDGGKTWRKNWIMEFNRTRTVPYWFAVSDPFTNESGKSCTDATFRKTDLWAGTWKGTIETMKGTQAERYDISLQGYKILDGCAVMTVMQYGAGPEAVKEMGLVTYNTPRKAFEFGFLDNREGTSYQRLYAEKGEYSFTFEEPEAINKDIRYKSMWHFEGDNATWQRFYLKGDQWIELSKANLQKVVSD